MKASLPLLALLLPEASALSGNYSGSVTILGQQIAMEIGVLNDHSAAIAVCGVVGFSCGSERYKLDKAMITLPDKENDGDCLHEELKQNHLTLDEITYSAATDSIIVTATYIILKVHITLHHKPAGRAWLPGLLHWQWVPSLIPQLVGAAALPAPSCSKEEAAVHHQVGFPEALALQQLLTAPSSEPLSSAELLSAAALAQAYLADPQLEHGVAELDGRFEAFKNFLTAAS